MVPAGDGSSGRQAVDHEAQTIVAPSASATSLPGSSGQHPPTGAAWSGVGSSRERLGGRYEILGLVGSGGMGTVYRARDVELDEVVALKVLRRELVDTPGILERFRREAKLSRRVTHRNVARVFDIGEHDGEKFLTMEFVDGEALSALLARERVGLGRAVEIAAAIAAGLSGAHAAGVVHRDLKPDNVLLARDGRVVVTDFGIARALADAGAGSTVGLMLGTPAYMAPEQVEGRVDVDARADVYAFGALLFELFTGARAWAGESPFAVAAARLLSPPPDPRAHRADLPPACADLVLACMARRREDRPASIDVVAASLAVLDTHTPVRTLASPHVSAERSPVPTPPAPSAPARPGEKTVAVLPFRNAGAPADDYLAEELTDDLIDSLSMTRGLKVRARGMVQRFRGGEHDPREVGRELGVQVVVEGSVRRAGGRVRVSARLVGVADGFQIWAKRFDRPEQDVLAINDEASHAIADALTIDLGEAPRAAVREAPSDPAVVDLYLRARHEYRKFGAEHQVRAIELFEQAEKLAPNDPMILSSKALALARRSFADAGSVDLARAQAERAIAIAPNLGDARLALGSVLFQLGEGKLAVRELRQAVTRSPGLAEAHAVLGRLLVEAGALDEGVRRLEAAIELDRDVPLAHGALARAHALRGEWADVERVGRELHRVEGDAGYWMFEARMALWRRDRAAAERLLAALPATLEVVAPRIVLELVATSRLPPEAVDFLSRTRSTEGSSRRRSFFLQIEVETSAFLGQEDHVLESVERAADVGLIDVVWLERCPLLDPYRGAPRFLAAYARVKQRTDEILAAYRSP